MTVSEEQKYLHGQNTAEAWDDEGTTLAALLRVAL